MITRGAVMSLSSVLSYVIAESVDRDHFEIHLAHPAVGAQPVFRHVFPGRAGSDAFTWTAFGFVVDEAAHHALPLFHVPPQLVELSERYTRTRRCAKHKHNGRPRPPVVVTLSLNRRRRPADQ